VTNIFFGHGLSELLARAAARQQGATVFAYHVRDPERYGVVTFDEKNRPVSIDEKPARPNSNWAITGLYFFDNDVVRHALKVRPSARGELEITDLQMRYLAAGKLHVERMGRGYAWLDTGTFGSLIGCRKFRPDAGDAAGHEGRVSRGNRLPARIHRPRSSAHAGQIIGEEWLRKIPDRAGRAGTVRNRPLEERRSDLLNYLNA